MTVGGGDDSSPIIADSPATRLIIIVGLIVGGLVAVFLARGVLTPVIVGGLIRLLGGAPRA